MADQGAEGILSPFLSQKRFDAVRPFLKGRVLDFGCGSGGLAEYVSSDKYLGIDIDNESVSKAKVRFPSHKFLNALPENNEKFDTISLLAVIEHVSDPVALLNKLTTYLSANEHAKLVITTPHPSLEWIHTIGASLGLFSKHANEEHESLLDRNQLVLVGKKAGLKLEIYKRFLLGANQLAIFSKEVS